MKIIATLYIQNGKVVSWYKGNDNELKKTYPKAPKSYASFFNKEKADALFVVDLDGDQEARLTEIKEAFDGEIWWAGQVRTLEKIQKLLDAGAHRIVLGQSAKDIYGEALSQFGPEKLIAGIKVKHHEEGADLCEKLSESAFTDILVKDLNSEGTLFHPNFDLFEKCVYFSGKNVYSSGGVSEESHVEWLERIGVKGVVIARALYESKLSISRLKQNFPS